MQSNEAVNLINNQLTYKPGWNVRAYPLTEGTVMVSLSVQTRNSDRQYAPDGFQMPTVAGGGFEMVCQGSREDVIKRLIGLFTDIEQHEHREFTRLKPSYDAPFHPHRYECDMAWERAAA